MQHGGNYYFALLIECLISDSVFIKWTAVWWAVTLGKFLKAMACGLSKAWVLELITVSNEQRWWWRGDGGTFSTKADNNALEIPMFPCVFLSFIQLKTWGQQRGVPWGKMQPRLDEYRSEEGSPSCWHGDIFPWVLQTFIQSRERREESLVVNSFLKKKPKTQLWMHKGAVISVQNCERKKSKTYSILEEE